MIKAKQIFKLSNIKDHNKYIIEVINEEMTVSFRDGSILTARDQGTIKSLNDHSSGMGINIASHDEERFFSLYRLYEASVPKKIDQALLNMATEKNLRDAEKILNYLSTFFADYKKESPVSKEIVKMVYDYYEFKKESA